MASKSAAPGGGRASRTKRADGRATHARILRAAKTMFAAGGYEATSLRQIAGAADVDLATLKYHVGSKADLFGEVYRSGHEAFVGTLAPFVRASATAATADEVREVIEALAFDAADFLVDHEWFVRLFLYRLLEDASDISGLEEQLEGVAISLIDSGIGNMVDRGLLPPFDHKSMVAFLVGGLAMYVVTSRHKAHWLGEPNPMQEAGRARFRAFVREVLVKLLAGDHRKLLTS